MGREGVYAEASMEWTPYSQCWRAPAHTRWFCRNITIRIIGRSQPNYGPCFRLLLKQAVCGEYQARYD